MSRNWKSRILLIAVFLPAVVTAALVGKFAVNVPVWDDWERAPLIDKLESGKLEFSDLYAPHIEHRMFFPRLILLASNRISGGDLTVEMWIAFLVVVLTAIALFLLLRMTFPGRPGIVYPGTFCINLVLFSPLQWENFLWAIQVAFLLPMCCLCWALVVLCLGKNWSLRRRFAACLILAIVGSHSFSHGLLIWPVVLMMALLQSDFGEVALHRLGFAFIWAAIAAVVIGFYFSNFHNTSYAAHAYNQRAGEVPPAVEHFDAAVANPGKVISYFAAFLGNPLARITRLPARELAPWIGWMLFLIFEVATIWWIRHWNQEKARDRALPWLALGGVAITLALTIALSRSHVAGLDRSLVPRYISMSQYLLLAVAVLGILVISAGSRRRFRAASVGPFAVGLFLAFQLTSWSYGIEGMRQWQANRFHSLLSLLFIDHFLPSDGRLDVAPEWVREQALTLDAMGYLDPPLLEDATLDRFKLGTRPLPSKRWRLAAESSESGGDIELRLEGSALLPEQRGGGAAHGVLITNGDRVIHVACISALPRVSEEAQDNEFNAPIQLVPMDYANWSAILTEGDLALDGAVTLRFWAVDVRSMRAYQLGGQVELNPGESPRVTKAPLARP